MNVAIPQPTVLIVDDEKNIRESIRMALTQEGIRVLTAHDAQSALRLLRESIVDALVLDIRLGEVDGIALYKKLVAEGTALPAIFISGHATLTEAAQAMKCGGFDFLEKPFSAEKIVITVQRCLEYSSMKERLRLIEGLHVHKDIVGESPSIRALVNDVAKVAASNASVLISGESGTGKELVTNAIHAHSARSHMPLVKVNCSAIPDNLVESELFGHEKGAFTGAALAKKGLFELAHRGTIFLDEVADLALPAQAKVLRVLQNGELQKLGAQQTIKVDVRVLSATHKDLKQCIQRGEFREDLYYRLNVVPVNVPNLRDRATDIPLLVNFLLKRLCDKNNMKEKHIEDEALWQLKRYHWPGNVRELQNVLERMLIMSGERITVGNIPSDIAFGDDAIPVPAGVASLGKIKEDAERGHIIGVLRRHNGNVTQAAIELCMRRTYLHRRLALLGITKKDFLV